MVSFVGKLFVVFLLEGKMAAAFKFTMIAAVEGALGRSRGGWATTMRVAGSTGRKLLLLCSGAAKERKPGQRALPRSRQSTSCKGCVDISIALKLAKVG